MQIGSILILLLDNIIFNSLLGIFQKKILRIPKKIFKGRNNFPKGNESIKSCWEKNT